MYVAFQLKGLANVWWVGVCAAWTPTHGPPTWDVFVTQFTAKYYPASFKEKMDVALRNIKQGNKTVDEYDAEFSKMVHFVDHINQNEPEKARRFFEGLNSRYRHVMGVNRPSSYFAVVEQARGLELQYQLTEAEKTRINGANNNGGGIRGTTRMGVGLLSDPTSRSSSQSNGLSSHSSPGSQGLSLIQGHALRHLHSYDPF